MKNYRVGLGFDVHRFSKKGKGLVLGGAKIPCAFRLEAVSDGDVVLHAATDAVCGAACLGDIGDYFPPKEKKSKGIDSSRIAGFILNKIKGKYQLLNLDIIIVSEKPRLVKYKKAICASVKKIFNTDCVNIKIKSKEGLDILGGKNSMSCFVLAFAVKK
jgi:2-C-methyl-D-erythritol 2,4-cyclodiphosphate synthase